MPAKTSRKTGTKKKGASRTSTSKKKTTSKKPSSTKAVRTSQNRVLIVCLIVLFWALAIITMLRLGRAGKVLYGLLSFFAGSFTYVLLAGEIIWSFLYIWNAGRDQTPRRIWWGLVFLGMAWCMACALFSIRQSVPFGLFQSMIDTRMDIVWGTSMDSAGLIGAGLGGICTALFSKAGAWIIAAALLVMGGSLCFWEQIRQGWLEYQSKAPREKQAKEHKPLLGWMRPLFHDEPDFFPVELPAGPVSSSAVSAAPQSEAAARQPSFSSMPDLSESRPADIPQSLQPQKSVKTRPFSFELASGLLDAVPEELIETMPQAPVASKGKAGRFFGKNFLDGFSKKQSSAPASHSIFGFGITADAPTSDNKSLDLSLPSFGSSASSISQVTSGFGIQADDIPPVADEQIAVDMTKIAGTRMDFVAGPESKPSRKKRRKDKQEPAMQDLASFLPLQPALDLSANLADSSALSKTIQKNEMDLQAKEALADLAALPGKTEEAITRARTKPEEQKELLLSGGKLPVAASTDLSKYKLPKIALLNDPGRQNLNNANVVQARADGAKLIAILAEFGVKAELNDIHIGPSVTKFEITPGTGVRVNSITNLQNDIKMALAATDIRIEAPIPGKSAVGIEVPNVEKTEVSMRDLLRSLPKKYASLPLVFALGKDLMGENVYGRLDTMPHLLIAGATGSGKSVCVNAIISSILMRTRPDEVKLILVDPKKVEFTPYNGVPHLLAPVITDGDLANKALQVVVAMMDRRYDLFEETMVRNITAYNAYVDQNPDSHYQKLPRIVVIIDELADLMLAAAKEVEQSIQRITQLARAAGIHLIVATQRPSVNVITGVIKANIPSRIAFAVSSTVDSRTILDQAGAERLLGYGDMLFLDNGDSAPRRIQGVYIKDEEVMRIAEYVKSQAAPMYDDAFITLKDLQSQGNQAAPEDIDPLYEEVKHFVVTSRKASTSLIQRRFSIGYARAARLVDSLEYNGVVGPANGSKPREILAAKNYDPDDLDL